jgi:hypothetical protein
MEAEPHYGDFNYTKALVKLACSHQNFPHLVSVSGYFADAKLWLYYLVDGPISEDEQEELSCVSTEIISDFYKIGLEEHYLTKLPEFEGDHFVVEIR